MAIVFFGVEVPSESCEWMGRMSKRRAEGPRKMNADAVAQALAVRLYEFFYRGVTDAQKHMGAVRQRFIEVKLGRRTCPSLQRQLKSAKVEGEMFRYTTITYQCILNRFFVRFFHEQTVGEFMAERVGFEPTEQFPTRCLSKAVLSTTQPSLRMTTTRGLAEREGFEPPVGFTPQRFSRPPPSTARPSLQLAQEGDRMLNSKAFEVKKSLKGLLTRCCFRGARIFTCDPRRL